MGLSQEWPITPDLFHSLLQRHWAGDAWALPELVLRMTPIIRKRAWRFAAYAEVQDLFQQGVLLLIEILPKIRTDHGAAPIQYSAAYISGGLRSYCLIACPVSRPLKLDRRLRLVPAARVVALGDLEWIYDATKVREIPPIAPATRERCAVCKRFTSGERHAH